MIPEILACDLFDLEDDLDIEIWLNSKLAEIEQTQPIFMRYLEEVSNQYGQDAVCSAIMTFDMITNALLRETDESY